MEAIARVVWCLLLAVLQCDSSLPDPTQLFLDSPAHCGKVYNVTNTSVYRVTTNVSKTNATHAFQACDLIFKPIDSTDRVCAFQRHLSFSACDVILELQDGHVGVDPSDGLTVECGDSLEAEWCSSEKPALSISVTADGTSPSLSDVAIDLLVYSLRYPLRHVPMETAPYCDSYLTLDQSRINVTNIDPIRPKTKGKNPKPSTDCSLTFSHAGRGADSFLCVEFHSVRAANPLCTTPNYTLQILLSHRDVVGVRSCQNPEPIKWCSNSTQITLRLLRHGTPEAEEDEVVFYALVMDQAGPFFDCFFCTTTTAKPSLSKVTMARGSDTSSASANETTVTYGTTESSILTTVLGAAGCVVVLALVLVHCLLWRRKPTPSSTDNRKGSTKRKASANRRTSSKRAPSVKRAPFLPPPTTTTPHSPPPTTSPQPASQLLS